jgi:Flp pilus assembly protein TadD
MDPNNKEAINYKIALMIELGKKNEAFAFVKKYAKENPAEEFPHYYLGLMAYEADKIQEAEKEFLTAISFNPEHEPSIVTLMLMYEKTYSGEHLLQKLETLSISTGGINDDLNNRIIMVNIKLGGKANLNKAIDYLTQVYGDHPLPYIAIEKSSLYDRIENKEAAINELSEAINNYPKNDALIYALAILFDKYGQKENALKTMEKLAELNPNDPEVLNYIGYSYADKGIELKRARVLLEKALKLSPDDPYVLDSMAWLNYKEGRLDAAQTETEKVAQLIQQKSIFELDILDHMLTIYKKVNDIEGQTKVKKLLTDMLNSKKYNDKKGSIKILLERINEEPQRSPASIKK